MGEKIVFPKKIVKCENVVSSEFLLIKKPMQIGLSEPTNAVFSKNSYIILDFGKEMNGSVRILTHAINEGGTANIRVRFGESLTESCSSIDEKNSTNDHSPRDFTAILTSFSDITLGASGYRFIRIDFLDDKTVNIKSIVGTNNIYSKKAIFAYNGKDKLIKDIYLTAKRTVDLCLGKGYLWDGIKRDRLVWIGDIHPEMLALTAMYGECKELEKSLEFSKEQTPLPFFMSGFPTYSMWWITIVCDYFRYTGRKEFTQKQLDYVEGLIKLFDTLVDEKGDTHYPFYFVDWPTHEQEDEIVGSKFINIIAVKRAIELFKNFNKPIDVCEKLLNKLLKGNLEVKDKKQVIALKYFALGSISDKEYNVLTNGGAKGMSTFMSYYILTAIASKDKNLAIKIMKDYYGKMLELGATTFFEDFDIDWMVDASRIDKFPKKNQKDIHGDFGAYCYKGFRHSLCHGWSSGVIRFIKENC